MHTTYQDVLPFVLAILLIWIIPMLLSRFGLTAGDLMRLLFSGFRKRDHDELAGNLRARTAAARVPHLKNSGTAELMELVSALVTFSRRHQTMLVYPGTVSFGGKTANLVAFVVTKREIIGLNCFGYSGTVGRDDDGWYQSMNGVRTKLDDPLALSRVQAEIVAPALRDAGLSAVPFRVLNVFTSRTVTLVNVPQEQVYTQKGLLSYLIELAAQEKERISPEETARKIHSYVVRIKSEKKRR